jgi:shikimate kinase
MPNLYLIGYRGCGKTTVARRLSELLNLPALDADEYLEQQAGKTIREIFAAEGEAGFRQREADVVQELTQRTPLIVSWGGGVILSESNRQALRATGKTVWLRARAETLVERIERDPTTGERRPNLTAAGGLAEVQHLLAVREPLYSAAADRIIEADDVPPESIAAEIAAWYREGTA